MVIGGRPRDLNINSRFTNCVGKRGNTTVVLAGTAVQTDCFDTRRLHPFGHGLTHFGGGGTIPTLLAAKRFLGGAGRRNRFTRAVVNHLAVDMLQTAPDRQSRAFGIAL